MADEAHGVYLSPDRPLSMPADVPRKATKWIEHQVDESLGNTEKTIVVTLALLPDALKTPHQELQSLRLMSAEFQEMLHAASFEADGVTKAPSTAQMIEEEVMGQLILPMPIKTPPLLALLIAMDPDLSAMTPKSLAYTPASVVYKSLSIFLVYLMRSRAVTMAGEKHRYLAAETKERIEEAVKGLGMWARDCLAMNTMLPKLAAAKKAAQVKFVSELDLSKFYSPEVVEQGLKAVHQYIHVRIIAIELAIIACLGIHPRVAAKEGLISQLEEPVWADVGTSCRQAVSATIDAILTEEGSPYSKDREYPFETAKMRVYGIPNGFFHEALCIFFAEM
jgi:hypothetical protein